MTLLPGTRIGDYVVRRKLAEGGMAEIFLASRAGPDGFEAEVVLKQIRSYLASDPEFVEMFKAEARYASRLLHDNVVRIHELGQHEGSWYIAMEYVRGRSLWQVRKRSREALVPMPPTLVAHIGAQVARGLHFAHRLKADGRRLGLVHRDVSPHNVLLSYEGAVKLTDFGIAKAADGRTAPGTLKGKFAYMAPEQARGGPVDARTDVFALGIVLWEMLAGARLFDGEGDVAVLRAVQQAVVTPPARLNPDVPAALDAIVLRALERDPARRFQSARDLERALAQFVLSHARTVEDTDVGAFLRRLFAADLAAEGVERPSIATDALMPPPLPRPEGEGSPRAKITVPLRPPKLAGEAEASSAQAATYSSADAPVRPSGPTEKVQSEATQPARRLLGRRVAAGVAALAAIAVAGAWLARPGSAVDAEAAPRERLAAAERVPESLPAAPEPSPPSAAVGDEPPRADAAAPRTQIAPTVARPAQPRPAAATGPGTLVVEAKPWANVILDGVDQGEVSGKRAWTLPPGGHVVRFVHPRRTLEKTLTVRSQRRQSVVFDALAE